MLLPLSALLLGIALGLRYNVYVLIPGSITAATTAACIGYATHDSYFAVALLTIFTTVVLQIGFLVGGVISSSRIGNETPFQQVPIERGGVVHFHQYRLAKTQSL